MKKKTEKIVDSIIARFFYSRTHIKYKTRIIKFTFIVDKPKI